MEVSPQEKLWYFQFLIKICKVTAAEVRKCGSAEASFKTYPTFMDEFKYFDSKSEQFAKLQ
jgi:hypothetical protein